MHTRRHSTVQEPYIVLFLAVLLLTPSAVWAQHRQSHRAASAPGAFDAQMLATQVALDHAGFSPGEIDGQGGTKTKLALAAFHSASTVPLDRAAEPLVSYTISEQDVAGPFIGTMPGDMMEASKLPALGYTTALEGLAEKFHSSPMLLRRLNPGAAWKAGEAIKVPGVQPLELPAKSEKALVSPVEVVVSNATKSMLVRDASGKTLMYAPVTTGSEHDPLPIGEWKVVGVSWNPAFNYNPDLFWDADPTHTKAKIPAGPNSPVGMVWVDINKPHYGLHGTPEPSTVGRTESHGCIRLTNWDAVRLGHLVNTGTKVIFQ